MRFKVCCVEQSEPFIYYFFDGGHITTEVISNIEDELLLQLENEIQTASINHNDLIISADFVEGETQYCNGYIHNIPSYWNLEVTRSEYIYKLEEK